jgi:hypothetical protein
VVWKTSSPSVHPALRGNWFRATVLQVLFVCTTPEFVHAVPSVSLTTLLVGVRVGETRRSSPALWIALSTLTESVCVKPTFPQDCSRTTRPSIAVAPFASMVIVLRG